MANDDRIVQSFKSKDGRFVYEKIRISASTDKGARYEYVRRNAGRSWSLYNDYENKYLGKRGYQEAYKRAHGVQRKSPLSERLQKQLFSKSSWGNNPWVNKNGGHIQPHLKPLTLSSKDVQYRRIQLNTGRTNSLWGAKIRQGKGVVTGVLNGFKEFIQHINIAKHMFTIQAENFRITVGQRALRIFEESFKYHKFYNEDTEWKPLASFTRKKRKWRGTWNGDQLSKLKEYGKLAGSLQKVDSGPTLTKIFTKEVRVVRNSKSGRAKGRTFSYAGIHNEGVPKGNKWGDAVPKRQFMGWSRSNRNKMDKIDMFAYEIADRYLFDSVFLVKRPSK